MYSGRGSESKLLFLAICFGGMFVLANVLATKQIEFCGMVLTTGMFAFPLTSLIGDIVNEVYGMKVAKRFVYFGFTCMAVSSLIIQIAIHVPGAEFWGQDEAFKTTLGATFRITVASLVAFLVSQLWDVWIFGVLHKMTKGKALWLRNNVSTISAQIVDSIIFAVVGFWGVLPGDALRGLIMGAWGVKFAIALLDTPFCYWGVKWARKGGGKLWI